MYLVSLEDYPLGIWFFNEAGHQDGIFVGKRRRGLFIFRAGGKTTSRGC